MGSEKVLENFSWGPRKSWIFLSVIIIMSVIYLDYIYGDRHIQSTVRVHLVHAMTAETVPVAADLSKQPIGLNHKPACWQHVDCIHHRHLLSLLSPN